MTVYTIGYGGRKTDEFVSLLDGHNVGLVVDVRLRPDRASMGAYTLARTPAQGIQHFLTCAGIDYLSLVELGNPFVGRDDWLERYRKLFDRAGDLLAERLGPIKTPYALMCAEKRHTDCHRSVIADYLARSQRLKVVHIE